MAIAISCYSGGAPWQKIFFPVWTCIKPNLVSKNFPFTTGGSLDKKFFFPVWSCIKPNLVSKNFPFTRGDPLTKKIFSTLNMYQAKSGVKKFSLYYGGGSLDKKIFFPVWTCIKPNLVSKNFPFTTEGDPSTKKFFFQSEHVSSQIWCQKIFPLLRGGIPRQKNFFPLWTCIKPNLVSKNFPFTRGGSLDKKFFFQSEHVLSQIWCQKIFPLPGRGGSLDKNFFSSLNMYQAKSGVKNFSLYWDRDLSPPPPAPPIQGWMSLPKNLRPGTSPRSKAGSAYPKIWDLGPPPRNVNRLKLLPSVILRMAGGKYWVGAP